MGKALQRRLRQDHFDDLHHEALLNLMVAAAHIRARFTVVCSGFNVTVAQYNVLRILRGAHPHGRARGEISERLIERAPDVTRLIDRLEKLGLVERRRDDGDRRQSITCITRVGLALVDRMKPAIDAVHAELPGRLSARDARELSRLCEEIYGGDVKP